MDNFFVAKTSFFFYQWRVLFGQLTGLKRKQLKILTLYRLELNILLGME